MDKNFVERFDLGVDDREARQRFVNRVHNEILSAFLNTDFDGAGRLFIGRAIATKLGIEFPNLYPINFVSKVFLDNLATIEAIFASCTSVYRERLSKIVDRLLEMAERDLGIEWREGHFYPTGAKLLDELVVNEPLRWLREKGYETVVEPFEKGLRHLLEAPQRLELAADVVTDMYEALEALAKIVTGRDADLSANRELFISAVKASDEYKRLLREYIDYANRFRHAPDDRRPRPQISLREAESFVYLTGVFVRLSLP